MNVKIQEILRSYVVEWTEEESEQLIWLSEKSEEDSVTLSCYIQEKESKQVSTETRPKAAEPVNPVWFVVAA